MKNRTVILGLVFALFMACNTSTSYPDEVKELGTMYAQLDSLEKEILALDSLEIVNARTDAQETVQRLRKHIHESMPKETYVLLTDFSKITNSSASFLHYRASYLKDIRYAKEQVKTLQRDLDQNLLDENLLKQKGGTAKQLAQEHVTSERNAYTRIMQVIGKETSKAKHGLRLYHKNKEKVVELEQLD